MTGAVGCLEDRLDRRLARVEVRREAALVADPGLQAAVVQDPLERVVDLVADPQRLGKAVGADRNDHELLQVDRVVGMHTAVDHVQHRDRQGHRSFASQVPKQRELRLGRGGLRDSEGDPEDRVRPQAPLVRRAVELDQGAIEAVLVERIVPPDGFGDFALDVGDGLRHALAAVGLPAVAQLNRFVRPR